MVKMIGLALVALGLLAALVRVLVVTFASDETKIRWVLEDAAEGFGDARANPVLDALARDFQDETSGYTREDLRGPLAAVFFQEKDPETKGFPYRLEIAEEALEIAVTDGEPATAHVAFPVVIVDTRGGARREAWAFRVEGRMEERDDGWVFVRTTHATTGGSMRLRPR
jgi:hypothetical protein